MKLVFVVLAILCSGPQELVEPAMKEAALTQMAEVAELEVPVDDSVALLHRGVAYIVLERFADRPAQAELDRAKAADALDAALAKAPNAFNPLLLRSYVAVRQGDFATAIADGQKLALRENAVSADFDVLNSIYVAAGLPDGYRVFIAETRRLAFILGVEEEAWSLAIQDRRFGDAVAIATGVLASTQATSDKGWPMTGSAFASWRMKRAAIWKRPPPTESSRKRLAC